MKIIYLNILFILSAIIWSEDPPPAYSYAGGWPVNPKSNEIEDLGFELPCPGPIGCECQTNADCDNQNCNAHPKGNYCVPKKGDIIPRFEALDQFGESVDIYDFAMHHVITLERGINISNEDIIIWDGRNDRGQKVVNGTYFCRLSNKDNIYWTKLVVIN